MRTAFAPAEELAPPAKPRGGYRIITAAILAAAWWAYRHTLIRLVDLRVWFAAHEMDARRCRIEDEQIPCFTAEELRKLTGLSPRRLKDSLRRLEAARLLVWTETALGFPDSPHVLPVSDPHDLHAFLEQIPNPDRKVPVPRRTLRLLAGGARPALIATVLAHLIRGLYLKRGRCLPRGRVKASWIAATFGVGLRRVKQARHELIACGWLIPLHADQWALNRWGGHFRINLEWSRLGGCDAAPSHSPSHSHTHSPSLPPSPAGLAAGPELAPPPAPAGPELAPPESHKNPLTGSKKNQEPASGGPAGISLSHLTEEKPAAQTATVALTLPTPEPTRPAVPAPAPAVPATSPKPAPPAGRPDLRNVVPEDLKDTGRLLVLFEQAIARGWVIASERDRLRFVGAAEHARAIGTRNPCGLFVRLVRCSLWSFLTQDDEDAASARLKRHLYGAPPERRSSPALAPAPRVVEELSEDARLVRAIRAALAQKRYQGDGFPLLRRERPEWTRERWDRALAELEQATTCTQSRSSRGPR